MSLRKWSVSPQRGRIVRFVALGVLTGMVLLSYTVTGLARPIVYGVGISLFLVLVFWDSSARRVGGQRTPEGEESREHGK